MQVCGLTSNYQGLLVQHWGSFRSTARKCDQDAHQSVKAKAATPAMTSIMMPGKVAPWDSRYSPSTAGSAICTAWRQLSCAHACVSFAGHAVQPAVQAARHKSWLKCSGACRAAAEGRVGRRLLLGQIDQEGKLRCTCWEGILSS